MVSLNSPRSETDKGKDVACESAGDPDRGALLNTDPSNGSHRPPPLTRIFTEVSPQDRSLEDCMRLTNRKNFNEDSGGPLHSDMHALVRPCNLCMTAFSS